MGPEFGPDRAAEIAEAMALDAAELWGSGRVVGGGRRVLVFAPEDAGPWFDARVPEGLALQAQTGDDLGARMRAFFEGEFADGADRVVLIAADCPTLDPSIVVGAFLTLEGRDVVLGPSSRGGFYLVGCRPPTPPIFEGIDRGSPDVLSRAIDRLRDTGLSLGVLPPWYDVETPEDWRALRGHLRALRRAGVDPGLPRLETLLTEGG